jgi:hypothetical protein
MRLQEPRSPRNSGGNVIDHKKRKREEKEEREGGGAGNFDFQLASRFLGKSKPPGIHSLAQTSTINPQKQIGDTAYPRVPTDSPGS